VLSDIDTRALVRHLRNHGVMRGVVSTIESDAREVVANARSIPKMDGLDSAQRGEHERPTLGSASGSHEPVAQVGVKDEPGTFSVVGL